MNPTAPAPEKNDAPVADFIRSQRQILAFIFLGLSVICLIGTIFLASRAFKTPAAPETTEEKDKEKPPEDPDQPPDLPKKPAAAPTAKRTAFMIGWIGGLSVFLITACVGAYLQVSQPKGAVDVQRREARMVVLVAGGLIGMTLVLFGGFYFYLWSDSLTNWLDKKQLGEAKWIVAPLLSITLGAGLVFISAMPARAEERNDLRIRRLVYGSTGGVTVLLLFVSLVILNVIVSMKVSNRLDTTETGFYTLSNPSREFLEKLGEPATLYIIMPESGDRLANDIRQFAYTAQDAARGKITVKFVSPVSSKQELARLREKYPRIVGDEGVLITVGEDEKRNTYIGLQDLFDIDPQGRVKGFAGEGKIVKELRYIADNESKPVVYFTQSNGELAIAGAPGVDMIGGTAMQLKAYLEKQYIEVKPLVFPIKNPAVPDDASVVIVAEPQSPFSTETVEALRKYMNNPAKKGKLIVLAGAMPAPDGKGMAKTGLEGLLGEFNVKLGDKFIYTYTGNQNADPRSAVVAFTRSGASNPIGQAIGAGRGIRMLLLREVEPAQGNPTLKPDVLMMTVPGQVTWIEDAPVTNLEAVFRDFENEQVAARKQLMKGGRDVAVVVSESAPNPHGGPPAGGAGRVIVVGNGFVFSDRYAERAGGTPITFDLVGAGVDWLRDRPILATNVESKKYKEYQPPDPAGVSEVRLLLLPLGGAMFLIIGLGTGVWVMRRK